MDAGGALDAFVSDAGSASTCPPALGEPAPWTPPDARHAHALDDTLRVNHLQAEGSHNSYHVEPRSAIEPWQYTHAPLDTQYESQGVRAVELDVWWTPRCERYAVHHQPFVDDETTCAWLSDCLGVIRTWSDAHPGHHPLFVQIEIKQPYDAAAAPAQLDALDAELRAAFPDPALILPADLQRTHASIRAALAADGWLTLAQARGRVLFFLDNGGGFRDAYTHGARDLDGRVIFAGGDPSDDWAAVAVLNDPFDAASIRTHVEAGFLVRTRADTDGVEARAGDRTRLDAALASGAHVVSTDFPAPADGIDYFVEIPGGSPSRCNPISAPAECTAAAIEDPARLAP